MEEEINAVSQSVHVTIVKVICQTDQRLSRIDSLARDEFDTTPPGPRVTMSQSLQLPGVILAP